MSLIKPHRHRHVAVHERIAVSASSPYSPCCAEEIQYFKSCLTLPLGSLSFAVPGCRFRCSFLRIKCYSCTESSFPVRCFRKANGSRHGTEHTTDQSGTIINNQGMCHFAIPGLVREQGWVTHSFAPSFIGPARSCSITPSPQHTGGAASSVQRQNR